ncbi:ubiquitin recognition factor in ER-associated degradation protein 1 [Ixodes scapularis]
MAFSGKGTRLDGKARSQESTSNDVVKLPPRRGIPDYDYEIGTLRFIRTARPAQEDPDSKNEEQFEAFSGEGRSLRQQKSRK